MGGDCEIVAGLSQSGRRKTRAGWSQISHGFNEAQLLFVDHASHVVCQDAHRNAFIALSATAVRPVTIPFYLAGCPSKSSPLSGSLTHGACPANPYVPRGPQPRRILQRATPDADYTILPHSAHPGAGFRSVEVGVARPRSGGTPFRGQRPPRRKHCWSGVGSPGSGSYRLTAAPG
jgi:hypothetical protein